MAHTEVDRELGVMVFHSVPLVLISAYFEVL